MKSFPERFRTSWFDILSDHLESIGSSFLGKDLPWLAVKVFTTVVGVKGGLILIEMVHVFLSGWETPALIGAAVLLHLIYSGIYVRLDDSKGSVNINYIIGYLAWAVATTITLPLWWSLIMWFFSLKGVK